MNFVKKDVFAVGYRVKRLFRDKDGKVEREGVPSNEKTIHIAADTQDQAVEHAKNVVHSQEVGGDKERDNRTIMIMGVANGVKAVHVYVAPSAPVTAEQPAKPAKPAEKSAEKPLDQALREKDAPSAT